MSKRVEIKTTGETAILIGVITQFQDEKRSKEYLDELSFLAETAGAKPVKRFTQKMAKPNPRTFIGSGKIKEIADFTQANNIDIIIFDDELTPSQQRNIEFGHNQKQCYRIVQYQYLGEFHQVKSKVLV